MKMLVPAVIGAVLLAGCQKSENESQAAAVWGGDYQEANAPPIDPQTGEPKLLHPAAEPARPAKGFTGCERFYPGGVAPKIVAPEYQKAIEPTYDILCYRAFAVGHSGRTRTALWSSEKLDQASITLAADVARSSSFTADDNLPETHRAELDDYRGSGWERGHLAPSADMPSLAAQAESFRLSNIVPQNGPMNGGPWRELEMKVRKEARKRRVFVVTGPIFRGANQTLDNRVLIPTALFKAVYAVNKGATVFVVENDKAAKSYTLSIDQFARTFGLDPFPALQGVARTHDISRGPLPMQNVMTEAESNAGEPAGVAEKKGAHCGRYARARETYTWYTIDVFYEVYERAPYADEIDNCDGSNA